MRTDYNLKGTLTFAEYLECHKILAAKRRLWIRSLITVYGFGMVFYGIFFAPSKPDFTFTVFGAMLVVYGLIISPIQFKYRVKRNWDRYPKIKKEFDITVLDDGVQNLDDKGNPSHTSWDSFLRFQESESLFLLYLSPLLPLCLPKRLVSEQDLDGLRAILKSSIGQQAHGENDGGGQPATRHESE
jgi:hypothetical protein